MKLFLHIGAEKTGTTSVQHFLAENRAELRARGLFFPESLGKSNHRKLQLLANDPEYVDDFAIRQGLTDRDARDAAREMFWAQFREELAQAQACDRAVITSEQLHTRLREPREVARLAGLLTPLFGEIEIILYIRRQIDYAVSSYSTLIKSGGTRADLAEPGQLPIDYRQVIERWQTGFPDTGFTVRLFDRTAMTGGDVVCDFCQALGLDRTGLNSPGHQNTSLDLLSLEILRRVNRHVPPRDGRKPNPARANIVRFFERNAGGPGKQPTTRQIAEYERFFAQSNDWVRQRFFPERADLFAPVSARPAEPLAASAAELDHMAALLADVWTQKQKRLQRMQDRST